eukprot:CAMPEP_0185740310 /NCGR_PEP_ID=MMETSP1171-20130828/37502_1 /TAXON_ID=374046 /ORGANISM="Helicotheca tamensis, Strain CCMP826" /LENGTH=31 /DNA_ID= /DNA_START= /DNA_END= /DNA_ORIENTATION=
MASKLTTTNGSGQSLGPSTCSTAAGFSSGIK